MSHSKNQTQQESSKDLIIISSSVQDLETPIQKSTRICWNTGEEKNCPACYLSKGCKAKV